MGRVVPGTHLSTPPYRRKGVLIFLRGSLGTPTLPLSDNPFPVMSPGGDPGTQVWSSQWSPPKVLSESTYWVRVSMTPPSSFRVRVPTESPFRWVSVPRPDDGVTQDFHRDSGITRTSRLVTRLLIRVRHCKVQQRRQPKV